MLTPHGVAATVGGVAALVVGRVFGVLELFVIGSALLAAACFALVYVRVRRPRLEATRWIHPTVLVAGDVGRVDIHLLQRGHLRSAASTLSETVRRSTGESQVARLPLPALGRSTRTTSGYRLPSTSRGVIDIGPLHVQLRDPLGMAVSEKVVAGHDEVAVAPRVVMIDMPELGQGRLGAALLDRARRLGPGDFHGLREYARGDEPRSIHWRASARTDTLMVKEHAIEGLHRCTVIFDASSDGHRDRAGFERGVTIAASVVTSAARAGLTTRFLTAGGVDLRGPEVAVHTMRVLARIEPSNLPIAAPQHDTDDGLGLLIVVTGSRRSPAWIHARGGTDPTSTALAVTTAEHAGATMSVTARSTEEFVAAWQQLVGRGRLDRAAT